MKLFKKQKLFNRIVREVKTRGRRIQNTNLHYYVKDRNENSCVAFECDTTGIFSRHIHVDGVEKFDIDRIYGILFKIDAKFRYTRVKCQELDDIYKLLIS